ncbi:MAG: hypothetical protein FWD64_13995, partial [Acidobacteriaceae bacterium]|nr:hypothetical protein [Acidobacteriaceae bacterium]
ENRDFYSPDQEPTTTLPFKLWHVSGMDNYSIPVPMVVGKPVSSNAAQAAPNPATGSGPYGLYLGSDIRKAYYGNGSLRGEGQNLGILSFIGTDLTDLQTYYANIGQTYPGSIITLLSTDGSSLDCPSSTCNDTEPTLDLAMVLGMAPGLANVTMYVGNDDTVIAAAMTTNDPLPMTISCSWTWSPTDLDELEPYLQRMAAQGQTFFTASGDNATWTSGWPPTWPADDPYVTTVGGTELGTNTDGSWRSESAWISSGGGFSTNGIAIPSWQQIPGVINASNQGSTTLRNGPDVAAIADEFYLVDNAGWTAVAGTSGATPVWAAYMALVNQQLAANGQPPIGFLNPLIYQMNSTDPTSYSRGFHDISNGFAGSYQAVTGYDLVTGWGSPTPALVDVLVAAPADFSLALPAPPAMMPGNSVSSTVSILASGGFSSAVDLTATNLPEGVTVEFTPTSISGTETSQATFTVTSTVALGTHPITITGTSGTVSHSVTVSLTVGEQPDFTLAANPNPLMLMPGPTGTGSAIISISPISGFSSPVTLSMTSLPWQEAEAGESLYPVMIYGTLTARATFTVPTDAVIGTTVPVTITGTSGNLTHTTTLNITVGSSVPDFSIGMGPQVGVMPGSSGTLSVWPIVAGGFSSPVTFSITGQPDGVTVEFSPSPVSAPDTSVATFTVASTVAPGGYYIELTGTGGGITHSVYIPLVITTMDFSIAASPETLAVMPGNSGSSTVSVNGINGFPDVVGLSAAGQPDGVAVTFSPSLLTGPGTSQVTFAVASTAA